MKKLTLIDIIWMTLVSLFNFNFLKKENIEDECVEESVVPIQVNGSVDADLTKLSASELTAWGLTNLSMKNDSDMEEEIYGIRHGRNAVNDFGRPLPGEVVDENREIFFEKAFPVLFPYGIGGIEADRVVNVNFAEHVRWCLQYHDRRFRRHETFPFIAFGILQDERH